MKIEILMLKENNERGVRMMFLSLEQLQKLKLNPTRADYEIAYETEVKEQEGTALNVSEIMEGLHVGRRYYSDRWQRIILLRFCGI